MFSVTHMHFGRLLPHLSLAEMITGRLFKHQTSIDLEEMPESWQRDVGIIDGRDRRGAPDEGAFRAARMIYTQRSL
jgi:hypothetical protein